MSHALSRSDLMSLEEYAEKRNNFRASVMQHKKDRQLALGDNARLYFEDQITMQYQVQEVLRVEKTFDAAGIEEELEAYNPLIPDGSNWKATFMLEYDDVEERKVVLGKLIGIERQLWLQVGDHDKIYPIANEDLTRETAEKTSSVHFLRFELTAEMIATAKSPAHLFIGCDHEHYQVDRTMIPANIAASLVQDLD